MAHRYDCFGSPERLQRFTFMSIAINGLITIGLAASEETKTRGFSFSWFSYRVHSIKELRQIASVSTLA